MVAEFGPFGVAGLTVFLAGPLAAAAGDELPVVADDLGRVDGDVPLGGIEVEVAQELGGDVDRQAAVKTGREQCSNHAEWVSSNTGPVGLLSSLMGLNVALNASSGYLTQRSQMHHHGT